MAESTTTSKYQKYREKKQAEKERKEEEEEKEKEKIARTRFVCNRHNQYVHQATKTLILHPTKKIIIGKVGRDGKMDKLTEADVKLCKRYRLYYDEENVEKAEVEDDKFDED